MSKNNQVTFTSFIEVSILGSFTSIKSLFLISSNRLLIVYCEVALQNKLTMILSNTCFQIRLNCI